MCDSEKEASSHDKEKKDDENNVVLTNEQIALMEDQRQELADLRRQVVFLQVSYMISLRVFDLLRFVCFQAIREEATKATCAIASRLFFLASFAFKRN